MSALKAAIFLDRDGVLNKDYGYVGDPARIHILPRVAEALLVLAKRGYLLVVITNQSGVARGFFTEDDVKDCNQALEKEIQSQGGPAFDLVLYCPHHPQGVIADYKMQCSCRKPEPGMILSAQKKLDIDLPRSFLIGDKADDVECAIRAGVPGLQIPQPGQSVHPRALAEVGSLADCLPLIPPLA